MLWFPEPVFVCVPMQCTTVIRSWTGRDRDAALREVVAVGFVLTLMAKAIREITTLSAVRIRNCGRTE